MAAARNTRYPSDPLEHGEQLKENLDELYEYLLEYDGELKCKLEESVTKMVENAVDETLKRTVTSEGDIEDKPRKKSVMRNGQDKIRKRTLKHLAASKESTLDDLVEVKSTKRLHRLINQIYRSYTELQPKLDRLATLDTRTDDDDDPTLINEANVQNSNEVVPSIEVDANRVQEPKEPTSAGREED